VRKKEWDEEKDRPRWSAGPYIHTCFPGQHGIPKINDAKSDETIRYEKIHI
jgi:hypothetical protein